MELAAQFWELLSGSQLLQLLLLLLLLIFYVHYAIQAPFRQLSHLPQESPHWWRGNEGGGHRNDVIKDLYMKFKKDRFCVFWEGRTPTILVTDLEIIKSVMVTDFDHFNDLGFIDQEYRKKVGLVFGLADAYGEEWKVLKRLITPTFSAPKVKKAAKAMNQVGDKMNSFISEALEKGEDVDVMTVVNQYAITTIGAVGFGIDVDCFKDKDSEFVKQGNLILSPRRLLWMARWPGMMTFFKIRVLEPSAENFFVKLAESLVKQRQNSMVEHNDMLDSLIKAAAEAPDLMTPSMMFMTIVQFFTDGNFTFTEVFASILYLLAAHPEIQDKLQEELDTVLEGKKHVTEEDLREMPYLDQVINEGLRRVPFSNTARFCTKDYRIPGTSFTIPKGMKVMIPTAGLHFDPEFWPEPDTFDPERFAIENKTSIAKGAYQPFGFGPRQCIGYNLMKTESKVMFCHLLRNFRLGSSEDLPKQFKLNKDAFLSMEGLEKIRIMKRY